MSNHVNLIKGLAQRFEKNMLCQLSNSKKLRKVDKQILNQIRNNFAYIFTEDSDEVFRKIFLNLYQTILQNRTLLLIFLYRIMKNI